MFPPLSFLLICKINCTRILVTTWSEFNYIFIYISCQLRTYIFIFSINNRHVQLISFFFCKFINKTNFKYSCFGLCIIFSLASNVSRRRGEVDRDESRARTPEPCDIWQLNRNFNGIKLNETTNYYYNFIDSTCVKNFHKTCLTLVLH